MAYLGRLITGWAPLERIRSFEVRFAAVTPVHGAPICTGRVVLIETSGDERLATLELTVSVADGTVTLLGAAVVSLD
jgi:hypothetical protein